MSNQLVLALTNITQADHGRVGGKSAALGEMLQHLSTADIKVPAGFSTTVDAYAQFISHNQLATPIAAELSKINPSDVNSISTAGLALRSLIANATLPSALLDAVTAAYQTLGAGSQLSVAVRSSAVLEDLDHASFAGQQDSYLNVTGVAAVLAAIKQVYASLYTDRAIAYRQTHNMGNSNAHAMCVTVQAMVNASSACSGVMFSRDTESGFAGVVFITANYGLGDTVVKGLVNPDEIYIAKDNVKHNKPAIVKRHLGSKHQMMVNASAGSNTSQCTELVDVAKDQRSRFALSDSEAHTLAKAAITIEAHYNKPMDIEWAKDGDNGQLYIVQARADTSQLQKASANMERYLLKQKGTALVEGRSIGNRIASGKVTLVRNLSEAHKVQKGDVVVSDMADPDWEVMLRKAAAIVTNRGGRTSHAAIIARELGIPAIVGTGNATELLKEGSTVTVSCAEGNTGFVYAQALDFEVQNNSISSMPDIGMAMQFNIGNPDRAFYFADLPNNGVGLARLEFMIERMIGIHPKALLDFDKLPRETQHAISSRAAGYASPVDFYVDKLVEGISTLAVAFSNKPVVVRLSDFKSNGYASLIGGKLYEPSEENPALGFRGASRYMSNNFRDCFALECKAIRRVREDMGFNNVHILIPFIRSLDEAQAVIALLESHQLKRGDQGLQIYMMCELPVNALLADAFLQHFDGFMLGTNDLTQLTLGVDKESGFVAHLFDEESEAVKKLALMAIDACKKAGKHMSVAGDATERKIELIKWFRAQGVNAITVDPKKALDIWFKLAH